MNESEMAVLRRTSTEEPPTYIVQEDTAFTEAIKNVLGRGVPAPVRRSVVAAHCQWALTVGNGTGHAALSRGDEILERQRLCIPTSVSEARWT